MCTVCVVKRVFIVDPPGQKEEEEKRLVDCIIRALNDDLQVVFLLFFFIFFLPPNPLIFIFIFILFFIFSPGSVCCLSHSLANTEKPPCALLKTQALARRSGMDLQWCIGRYIFHIHNPLSENKRRKLFGWDHLKSLYPSMSVGQGVRTGIR